ncbi:MAG: hypothetical protein QF842_07160 [Candidatus Marinimicrobia bacterium]|jgi:hypothetical protein|nr:hypothetical protein [Candidatus Neomarinimicrobiota bacterium]MDP6611030.1 hypothetical protein [Candidatus Neomarinimicrobiota bacterium]|tara:strand:- start:65735 stop:66415 length:681 start_codon:yes stop_codon:yes gene_type:complete
MNLQKQFLISFPRYGIVLFLVLMILSMVTYGGGTINDPESMGYSFTLNFFSDLGKFTPGNFLSMLFFALSLCICGFALMAYFYYFMQLFIQNNALTIIAKIGAVVGIIGALCFVGVGFTPHNVFFAAHNFFANWAFRCFLITSILLSWVLYKDYRFENRYASGYLIFALLIFIYILILEFGPNPRNSDFSLIFNVLAQKLIVFVFILSVLYQSFGYSKLLARNLTK